MKPQREMTTLTTIRRALVSVSDKRDIVAFARALAEHGVEIISTGGTARALDEAGLHVIPVNELTGFPEMMDARVKTLHPAVHGAVLARRDLEHHVAALNEHNIRPIDLVCVNLYPFERTLSGDLSREESIELIDIGGPAILRSAAKNHDFVTVVTSPTQYDRVVSELKAHEGATTIELRRDLAAAAFSRTAEYDAQISAWMCSRQTSDFPPMFRVSQSRHAVLRYGENPHQKASLYHDPAARGADVVSARQLHGKQLSYNNINDAAAALEAARDLSQTFPDRVGAVIIKHANPCGMGLANDAQSAIELAHTGDSLAAYGGILAVNTRLTKADVEPIVQADRFFEVVIAEAFDDDALQTLQARSQNIRLLAVGPFDGSRLSDIEFRSVPGGMLVQERDTALPDTGRWEHVAGPAPASALLQDGAFIWLAVKHLKSNAVALGARTKSGMMMIGAGCGHVDRVGAARLAIEKAGDRIAQSEMTVAASDGFFPFPDGPELLIDAGVQCIVQPGGSKRDNETAALCRDREVTLLLTGIRHFRH